MPTARTHAPRYNSVDVQSDAVVCMLRSLMSTDSRLWTRDSFPYLPVPRKLAVGDRGNLRSVQAAAEELVDAARFGGGIVDDIAVVDRQRLEARTVSQEATDLVQVVSIHLAHLFV